MESWPWPVLFSNPCLSTWTNTELLVEIFLASPLTGRYAKKKDSCTRTCHHPDDALPLQPYAGASFEMPIFAKPSSKTIAENCASTLRSQQKKCNPLLNPARQAKGSCSKSEPLFAQLLRSLLADLYSIPLVTLKVASCSLSRSLPILKRRDAWNRDRDLFYFHTLFQSVNMNKHRTCWDLSRLAAQSSG